MLYIIKIEYTFILYALYYVKCMHMNDFNNADAEKTVKFSKQIRHTLKQKNTNS